MGRGIRVKRNEAGIHALLTSDAVLAEVGKHTEAIVAAAGGTPNFRARVQIVEHGSKLGRAEGFAATATHDGRHLEATDRALTRAIDAGR